MINNNIAKWIFTLFIVLFFVSCEKETKNKEINLDNNVRFSDVNNNYYELKDYANQGKAILLFGFNTSCTYVDLELEHIKKIDSLYNDKIKVFGLGCDNTDDTQNLKLLIASEKIGFPVSKRFWNNNFDRLVFSDSMYAVPKIVLLDKYLNVIYIQNRRLLNTIDSVLIAYDNSINRVEKKPNPLTEITDKCIFPEANKSNTSFCFSAINYFSKVITNQESYIEFEDAIRCPWHSVYDSAHLFNNIDFEKYSLLVCVTQYSNCSYYKRMVYKDEVGKKIVYKIALKDVGILSVIIFDLNFVFIPKLPIGYSVEFQVDYLDRRCEIK